jgi:antitoxin ChpS
MLALPPVFLDQLKLDVGATVGLSIADGQLVIHPKAKPSYTLAELLAASDYSEPRTSEEREWLDAPRVGGELI